MKWEYRVVTYPSDTLEKELNRLGAEEWEVISTHFDRVDIHPAIGSYHLEAVQVTAVLKKPVR